MKRLSEYVRKFPLPKSVPVLLLAVAGFVLSCTPAFAQSGAGSIQGTVKDATGAVIEGADVDVLNTATGVATDTKSNHTGFYQAPELFTGHYRLTVKAAGMKTYETSVELLVSQNAVINPKMVAGEVSQIVEVNADTVQLTTNDSGAISSTLENSRIQQLPQNGRDITGLLALSTPGVETPGLSQPLLNGGDLGTLSYVIDGSSATNNNRGGGFQPNATLIDPDSIQEVHVETTNSTAQYATPGSAVLSTKSGTNKLHGTFFETARNNAFGVDRNRDDPTTGGKPEYIRNEFGLSAGGPVYIPKIYDGRNKTFWFFAYERYSLAQQNSSRIAVPTMAMRNGDYSGYTTAKGVPINIFDPATTANTANCAFLTQLNGKTTANAYCRSQFAYQGVKNTIDPSRESPLAAIGFALLPKPTTNDNPLLTGATNLVGTAPQLQITPKITLRVDHVFDQSNRMYVRYTQTANTVHITATPQSVAVGDIPQGAALGYKNAPNYSFNAAVGYTHIFSPSFFAETIVGADWQDLTNVTGVAPDHNYEQELGLPNNFFATGFPAIRGLVQNLPGSQAGNQHQTQRNFLVDENLTKIIGHHQILFGGRLAHDATSNKPASTTDVSTYTALPTALYDPTSKANYKAQVNTGAPDASFFLGSAGTFVVNLSAPRMDYHQWLGSMYVQDNFHVNSRLVLNLGLRYEAHPALQTDHGLMNTFDLKNDAVVLGAPISQLIANHYTTQAIIDNDQFIGMKFETAQEAGLPSGSLMNSYNWNFLPRVGFAWTLGNSNRSPVFRGGYGIYLYDTPQEDFANGPANNNPFQTTYTTNYSTAAQAIDGMPNELLRYNDPVQFGTAGATVGGVQNAVDTTSKIAITPGPPTTLFGASPNWMPARVQQVNATLEIPMPERSALRLSYIGSKSTDLDIRVSYNNTPSPYQWEASRGVIVPQGGASVLGTAQQNTYSTVATNPYDNTTYGASTYATKQGFANYNALQVNYQRLYHSGSAFQIDYTWAKGMRAGGDVGGAGSGTVNPLSNYPGHNGSAGIVSLLPGQTPLFAGVAPPAAPANLPIYETWHDMVKFQLYQMDPQVPAHHVKINGIYDIPVGRGKRFLSGTPRWLNEIVGGYQLAGTVDVISQAFSPTDGNFGPIAPLKVYKKSKPINDCHTGVCYKNYLWYNGYIQPQFNPLDPNYTPGATGDCRTAKPSTCVTGLGADYVPFQVPSHNLPTDAYYGTDTVQVKLLDGTTPPLDYDAGPGPTATSVGPTNYYGKAFLPGPYNWVANASIFKVFPIRRGMFLRVNVDAFNVFNMPGETNPDPATGIQSFLKNYNPARQLQITARFTF
jgi:hypothetical protein